jgi:DtxR family Mn-dependent transcriptional regulator
MGSPIINLIVFVVLASAVVALWWPGAGLFPQARRRRASAGRVMMEDALKHIYHGGYGGQTASISSVAGALQTSTDDVVGVLESAQRAGLVTLTDGRLLLTDAGNQYALQIIRAHRLWERYLADETGVEPTEWHAAAERYEHRLTPEEANELARKLGNPRFDPHGDPIPTRDGSVPETQVVALTELGAGERAHVVHIEDEPDIVYAQLVAAGVYLGMVLRVEEKTRERIVFDADGRSFVLAPIVAANISIQRLVASRARPQPDHEMLSVLAPGEAGEVVRISPACRGIERRRLMDLGIVPGTRIEFERPGLTGGLSAYRLRGTLIALRREQTDMITVRRAADARDSKGVA